MVAAGETRNFPEMRLKYSPFQAPAEAVRGIRLLSL
jgi:hypothetical protein